MSNWGELNQPNRLFFTLEEMSDEFGLKIDSARVAASRKAKSGELIRIRRNLYILRDQWKRLRQEELFQIANVIQTPSYVSFGSALSYFGVTTQWIASGVESVNPVRTRAFDVQGTLFRYFFCRPDFYFGYIKENGFFIAEPEKALLDTLYFISLGRYAVDRSALDLRSIQWRKVERWSRRYPPRFQNFLKEWRIHGRTEPA